MSKKFEDSEINKELAVYVWNGSKSFCDGVYVPTVKDDGHPCEWDFIDFSNVIECEDDVDVQQFEENDISNGYGSYDYADCTLLEILKMCHGQVVFEKSQIDW